MRFELSHFCTYGKRKVFVKELTRQSYISTENMLPNKGGVCLAERLPTVEKTQAYYVGDILVSNIRPYFKKIWLADQNGGCSNDILVFRANENCDPTFLYYILSSDDFFSYATATSKGTKMPRGDRISIMKFPIPAFDIKNQKRIVTALLAIDERIRTNQKINDNLEQQVQAIFRSWFVDFEPFEGVMPSDWHISTLGESCDMVAGGDKPKKTSLVKTFECPCPIYSNGLSNEGLYGYTDIPKIKDESVTVSARGTIGFVCLRHVPYVPIVRLVTLIPNRKLMSAKYLYLYLKQLHISGTGTTQQQLTVPDFRKTGILVPNKEVMNRFTAIVTPLFNTIWSNQEQNEKLAASRDILLPKLMSGEIDVSNIQL